MVRTPIGGISAPPARHADRQRECRRPHSSMAAPRRPSATANGIRRLRPTSHLPVIVASIGEPDVNPNPVSWARGSTGPRLLPAMGHTTKATQTHGSCATLRAASIGGASNARARNLLRGVRQLLHARAARPPIRERFVKRFLRWIDFVEGTAASSVLLEGHVVTAPSSPSSLVQTIGIGTTSRYLP
jgi:hypothetical protein